MRASPNIRPPQRIDLSDPEWSPVPSGGSDPDKLLAIFCANVIHIAPWRVAEGLFAGANRHLRLGGRLFLYGPFKRDGKHTALSNAVFDTSLRGVTRSGACAISPTSKTGQERRPEVG